MSLFGNRDRVLVIRPSRERESALLTLARTGAEIVVADHPDNDLAGFGDVQLVLPQVPSAFREGRIAELESRIAQFHAARPLTAIMADFDYLLPLVGRLNERFGLRGHTQRSGLTCSNKVVQRQALERAGIPQPSWSVSENESDAARFAARVGYPVVLKPSDRAASCAVAVVHDRIELTRGFAAAAEESWIGEVLVEEYLGGDEVSIEAVVAAGVVTTVAMTEKGIGGRTGVLKLDAVMPANLPDTTRAAVEGVATEAVLACGLTDGPAHTEVRITRFGPRVVEVNGRVGGVFLSHMVKAVTGIDLYEAWFEVLHGRTPNLHSQSNGYAVRRCVSDVDGVVAEVIVGDAAIRRAGQHLLTRCFVSSGQELVPIANGNEMRAAVVAFASDRSDAVAAADDFVAALQITTRPVDTGR